MTLKELSGVAEAVRSMFLSGEILSVDVMERSSLQFPRVQITEAEYISHFGRTLPAAHSQDYDQLSTTWGGAEFFCLVPKQD